MIADLDTALERWLARMLPDEVAIVLDPPTTPGPVPVVHAWLYAIREDPDGAPAGGSSVRDDDGRVVARLPAPRRYRFDYLLTAWAQTARSEHELLGQVLVSAASTLALPPEYLDGRLANGYPVVVRCAPQDPDRPAGTGWWAARPSARTALALTVLATLVPEADAELSPSPRRVALRSEQSPAATAPRPRRPAVIEGP
ncbi:Pvc16 family protein [Actinocatenispora sera]|uniref:Pvc16 N-terminal domain-containing protein n=1 Tax=Actinocatenispora sera TaxID=390989 RepID=A0A810LBF9_9ACTN|nr:Pvc16 family protein [Actinocatenispora sera]BCJ31902.1 hypothetical protein Asera_60100 [Actinocatenispora sera]